MSIDPSIVTDQFIVRIKSKAKILKSSSSSIKTLSEARDIISKREGFRDYQHICRTKNKNIKKNFNANQDYLDVCHLKDFKTKKCLVFDLNIYKKSKLNKSDFLRISQDMKYLRERVDTSFGSWYIGEVRDIKCLEVLHNIINGNDTVFKDNRNTFAIEVDNTLWDWFRSCSFAEVKEQVKWSMAFLMIIEPESVEHVLRQSKANGIEGFSKDIERIYKRYKSEITENINKIFAYDKYPIDRYNPDIYKDFNCFMKAELGFGFELLMKAAKVVQENNRNNYHEFDFTVKHFSIRDDDWVEYFVLKEYEGPLMRAESNEEVLTLWRKLFIEYNNL